MINTMGLNFSPVYMNDEQFEIVRALRQHQEEYFLTGSHFFGDTHSLSDYDFFIRSSAFHRSGDFLKGLGFQEHKVFSRYNGDPSLECVLRFWANTSNNPWSAMTNCVDVQVIKSDYWNNKLVIQQTLKKILKFEKLTGTMNENYIFMTRVWRQCITMLDCTPQNVLTVYLSYMGPSKRRRMRKELADKL